MEFQRLLLRLVPNDEGHVQDQRPPAERQVPRSRIPPRCRRGTPAEHGGPYSKRIKPYFPREIGPGVRRVATIRAYATSLQMMDPVKKADSITWFDTLEKHFGIDINILLTQRQETARQWCAVHQVRPQVAIVDESPIGDLHLHAVYNTLWPRLIIRPDFADREGEGESVVEKSSL
jgi:hypothetical protein